MLVPIILATAALFGAFSPEMVVRHAAEAETALSVCPRDEVLRSVDLPRLSADYDWAVIMLGERADAVAARETARAKQASRLPGFCASEYARDYRLPV